MNPNEILSKINNTAITDNIKNVSLELLQNYCNESLFINNKIESVLQFFQITKNIDNLKLDVKISMI